MVWRGAETPARHTRDNSDQEENHDTSFPYSFTRVGGKRGDQYTHAEAMEEWTGTPTSAEPIGRITDAHTGKWSHHEPLLQRDRQGA